MHTESIEYQADGARRVGYLAVDRERAGARPGVLIAPEASGVSDVNKERARLLASLGYVAFVMDYVGDGVVLDSLEKSVANLTKYREDPMKIRAIGHASLEVLRAQPECDHAKLAAIGYCFGGAAVFELARDGADLACTVGFHAQLSTKRPDDAHQIKGKILACIGSDDPMVPPEQRLAFEDEMKRGKVDWRLYVMGNQVHGFMNPAVAHLNHPALRYDAPTHQRAWRAMLDLFDETFAAR
ncbi:MAG TPA: dienelactone hydrolase family protein [Kofleriaceae bacterium]|nr:dienelactone hydrolase family protein [Kofleriaceae bacterium]